MGCHFLFQGGLPDPGIKPESPVSPAPAGGFFTTESPGKSSSMDSSHPLKHKQKIKSINPTTARHKKNLAKSESEYVGFTCWSIIAFPGELTLLSQHLCRLDAKSSKSHVKILPVVPCMSLNLLCLECSDVGAEFGGEEPRVRRVQAVCRHSGMSASCPDILGPGYGHKGWGA